MKKTIQTSIILAALALIVAFISGCNFYSSWFIKSDMAQLCLAILCFFVAITCIYKALALLIDLVNGRCQSKDINHDKL